MEGSVCKDCEQIEREKSHSVASLVCNLEALAERETNSVIGPETLNGPATVCKKVKPSMLFHSGFWDIESPPMLLRSCVFTSLRCALPLISKTPVMFIRLLDVTDSRSVQPAIWRPPSKRMKPSRLIVVREVLRMEMSPVTLTQGLKASISACDVQRCTPPGLDTPQGPSSTTVFSVAFLSVFVHIFVGKGDPHTRTCN